jgi:zinc finger-like protein
MLLCWPSALCYVQVRDNIARHMAREESQVFPLLERHLCATQQRAMVWRTLRAMPLRLLERLMPWVAASLSADDSQVGSCWGQLILGAE